MRYPSLLPALSLAAGVAAATGGFPLLWTAVLPVFLSRRRRRTVLWTVMAIFWSFGLLAGLVAVQGHAAACVGLPEPGFSVTGELVGTVLRSAEPAPAGERWILLTLDRFPGRPSVRLTVAASPPRPTAALDSLRAGDLIEVWATLRRPRPAGLRPGFDPDNALRARGWHASGYVKSARLVLRTGGEGGWGRKLDIARAAARRSLGRIARDDAEMRGVLGAMLLGEGGRVHESVRARLRGIGASHLLAISGLHAGAIAVGLALLTARIRMAGPVGTALLALLLAQFAYFVGGRPSVLRAVTVASWFAVGRELERHGRPLHALGLVGLLMLAWRPFWLFDPAFLLSFAAAAGLLLAAPGGRRGFSLRLSVAAYAVTAPIVAYGFGEAAPVGVAANLLAAPVGVLIVVVGYAALLLEQVPLAGPVAVAMVRLAVGLLLRAAGWAESVGIRPLQVTAPDAGLALVAVVITFVALARRTTATAAVAAVLQLAVHLGPLPPGAGESFLDVLDVGQGQAILLRDGASALLVDAAGSHSPRFDPGARIVAPWVRQVHGPRLEVLALSHGDLDHAGGAIGVLRRLEVGELWVGPGWWRDGLQRAAVEYAISRGVAVLLTYRGQRRLLGRSPLQVVGPPPGFRDRAGNARSLVVLWGRAPCRVLLPGDLEAAGEVELLRAGEPLQAELLVVSHHGSAGASSRELLARIEPRLAAVSCGFRNRFGHPAPAAVARVLDTGALLHRTDLQGGLRYVVTGAGWRPEVSGEGQRDRREGRHEQEREEHGHQSTSTVQRAPLVQ